jgi:hypothetical protein
MEKKLSGWGGHWNIERKVSDGFSTDIRVIIT